MHDSSDFLLTVLQLLLEDFLRCWAGARALPRVLYFRASPGRGDSSAIFDPILWRLHIHVGVEVVGDAARS